MDSYLQIFENNKAWVFDLHNGLLKELDVHYGEYFSSFRSIYDLKIDEEG